MGSREGAAPLVSKYFVCIIVRAHVQREKVFALPSAKGFAADSALRLTFWLADASHLLQGACDAIFLEGWKCLSSNRAVRNNHICILIDIKLLVS